MTSDDYTELPSAQGIEQSDDWVAWGHSETKTHTGKRHHGSSRHRSSSHHHHHHHHHHHRRRWARRIVIALVLVVVAALIACVAAFGVSAYGVMQDAQELKAQASALQQGISNGDTESLEESVASIQEHVAHAQSEMQGPLWAVAERIPELGSKITEGRELVDTASLFTPYLADLLGLEGKRTYLILAHNTSELKPSGGFIGSLGTVTVKNGKITLGDFGSFWDCNLADGERMPVTDEEAAILIQTYGVTPGDSGGNPDFPREAEMSKSFWENGHGGTINGVIALDSHVLASFMKVFGGVTMDDGTQLNADNVVEFLGHDMYIKYFSEDTLTSTSGTESDEYFARVAELAFQNIKANISSVDVTALAESLQDVVDENRLMVWMDDEGEEALAEQFGVSGELSHDETTPVIGAFLCNRVASKLDWWLDLDVTYSNATRNTDGSTTYDVELTLTNTLTQEEIDSVSYYITGKHNGSRDDWLFLYAPAGGTVSDVQPSNGEIFNTGSIDGLEICKVRLYTDPGETSTISYKVTTSTRATKAPTVRVTPTAN